MDYELEEIGHLGLLSQLIEEIELVKEIDSLLPLRNKIDKNGENNVSYGQRVKAMILNGLGFVNSPLYLSSEFFSNKATKHLLGRNVSADKLNDDALAKTLDKMHEYGETKFFTSIVLPIINKLGLLSKFHKLDSTSFSLSGEYKSIDKNIHLNDVNLQKKEEENIEEEEIEENEVKKVEITYGFSKDHRPDMKQIMLGLTVNGPANLPLIMTPLSGNASDKAEFQKIVLENTKKLKEQMQIPDMIWVADSALYSAKWLENQKSLNIFWLTRAPETINTVKEKILFSTDIKNKDAWIIGDKGYKFFETTSNYGGVDQRYIVIFSEQAYKKENETFERNIKKQRDKFQKEVNKISKIAFACENDALNALNILQKNGDKFTLIDIKIDKKERRITRGRPKKEDKSSIVEYEISATIQDNNVEIDKIRRTKGIFVLATNQLDPIKNSAENILNEYKGLQGVERGFKFLKDPSFMANKIYLKTPERITALMVIMTLSLFVYNLFEWKIRESCKKSDETITNLGGKETKKITPKTIFIYFKGISIIKTVDENGNIIKQSISKKRDIVKKILQILGKEYEKMYNI